MSRNKFFPLVLLILMLFLSCSLQVFAKRNTYNRSVHPTVPLSMATEQTRSVSEFSNTIISADTTWGLSGSPYIIKDKLTVAKGVSLTIESGVVIKMYPSAVLEINGSVTSQGTEQNSVVFTSVHDPDFGGQSVPENSLYWESIDISSTGNFSSFYSTFMYGKNIFNVKGILDIYFTQISHAGLTGINVADTGIVSGSDSAIKFCSNAIYDNGLVSLLNSRISDCSVSSGPASGIRPFGIEKQDLVVGKSYVLKYGACGQYSGNFHALALGGRGACNFKDKIINGYSGTLNIGDYVSTEPGNMTCPTICGVNTLISRCSDDCTFESHKPDCPRIITVVMVETLKVKGRKEVKITSFPRFFLDNIQYRKGHTEITAIYLGTSNTSAPGITVTDSGAFYGTNDTFQRCSKGIDVYGTVSLVGCKFSDCEYGLYFDTSKPSYFTSNSFVNNSVYGVYNNRPSEIIHDLSSSYWGSQDGPSRFDESSQSWVGSGDKVSKGIIYANWLIEAPGME